nr:MULTISPECIES: MMPL family transporter [unclassified Rhodococcus (in: high G+C Gram-positive bacteria)]
MVFQQAVVRRSWVGRCAGGTARRSGPGRSQVHRRHLLPATESATATELLSEGAPAGQVTESGKIVWHTDGTTVRTPTVQQTFTSVIDEISAMPAVTSPYADAGAAQIDPAATTAYVSVTFDKDADSIETAAERAESARSDSVDVEVGGQAFTAHPGGSHVTKGLGIVLAFVVLLLVFRSVWAAALPIITGIVGVATSLLLVVLASNMMDIAVTALTMGPLIGLGVVIDYALFNVNPYRVALTSGKSVRDYVATAVTNSGRAVIFAGLTVVIALLGMIVLHAVRSRRGLQRQRHCPVRSSPN